MIARNGLILTALMGLITATTFTVSSARSSVAQDKAPNRFEFEVVESFDAKYLGDTPGHKGRHGLSGRRPGMALGDPVYRGDEMIGHVTNLVWDRSKDSVEIEFDPEPKIRIRIGDLVWVPLGPENPK